MAQSKFPTIIKIISVILIATFIAQDIVWAYPDQFSKPKSSQNGKLAVDTSFHQDDFRPEAAIALVEDFIENHSMPRSSMHLTAIDHKLRSPENAKFLKENDIRYENADENGMNPVIKEVRLRIQGHLIIYYNPKYKEAIEHVEEINEHLYKVVRVTAPPPVAKSATSGIAIAKHPIRKNIGFFNPVIAMYMIGIMVGIAIAIYGYTVLGDDNKRIVKFALSAVAILALIIKTNSASSSKENGQEEESAFEQTKPLAKKLIILGVVPLLTYYIIWFAPFVYWAIAFVVMTILHKLDERKMRAETAKLARRNAARKKNATRMDGGTFIIPDDPPGGGLHSIGALGLFATAHYDKFLTDILPWVPVWGMAIAAAFIIWEVGRAVIDAVKYKTNRDNYEYTLAKAEQIFSEAPLANLINTPESVIDLPSLAHDDIETFVLTQPVHSARSFYEAATAQTRNDINKQLNVILSYYITHNNLIDALKLVSRFPNKTRVGMFLEFLESIISSDDERMADTRETLPQNLFTIELEPYEISRFASLLDLCLLKHTNNAKLEGRVNKILDRYNNGAALKLVNDQYDIGYGQLKYALFYAKELPKLAERLLNNYLRYMIESHYYLISARENISDLIMEKAEDVKVSVVLLAYLDNFAKLESPEISKWANGLRREIVIRRHNGFPSKFSKADVEFLKNIRNLINPNAAVFIEEIMLNIREHFSAGLITYYDLINLYVMKIHDQLSADDLVFYNNALIKGSSSSNEETRLIAVKLLDTLSINEEVVRSVGEPHKHAESEALAAVNNPGFNEVLGSIIAPLCVYFLPDAHNPAFISNLSVIMHSWFAALAGHPAILEYAKYMSGILTSVVLFKMVGESGMHGNAGAAPKKKETPTEPKIKDWWRAPKIAGSPGNLTIEFVPGNYEKAITMPLMKAIGQDKPFIQAAVAAGVLSGEWFSSPDGVTLSFITGQGAHTENLGVNLKTTPADIIEKIILSKLKGGAAVTSEDRGASAKSDVNWADDKTWPLFSYKMVTGGTTPQLVCAKKGPPSAQLFDILLIKDNANQIVANLNTRLPDLNLTKDSLGFKFYGARIVLSEVRFSKDDVVSLISNGVEYEKGLDKFVGELNKRVEAYAEKKSKEPNELVEKPAPPAPPAVASKKEAPKTDVVVPPKQGTADSVIITPPPVVQTPVPKAKILPSVWLKDILSQPQAEHAWLANRIFSAINKKLGDKGLMYEKDGPEDRAVKGAHYRSIDWWAIPLGESTDLSAPDYKGIFYTGNAGFGLMDNGSLVKFMQGMASLKIEDEAIQLSGVSLVAVGMDRNKKFVWIAEGDYRDKMLKYLLGEYPKALAETIIRRIFEKMKKYDFCIMSTKEVLESDEPIETIWTLPAAEAEAKGQNAEAQEYNRPAEQPQAAAAATPAVTTLGGLGAVGPGPATQRLAPMPGDRMDSGGILRETDKTAVTPQVQSQTRDGVKVSGGSEAEAGIRVSGRDELGLTQIIVITKNNCTYEYFVELRKGFDTYKKLLAKVKFEDFSGEKSFGIFNAVYESEKDDSQDVSLILDRIDALIEAVFNDRNILRGLVITAQTFNKTTNFPFIMDVAAMLKLRLDDIQWNLFYNYLDEDRKVAVIAQIKSKADAGEYVRQLRAQKGKATAAATSQAEKKSPGMLTATEVVKKLLGARQNLDVMDSDMLAFAEQIDRLGIKPGQKVINIGPSTNQTATTVLALYGCEVDIVEPVGTDLEDHLDFFKNKCLKFYKDDLKSAEKVISMAHPHRQYLRDFLKENPDIRYDFVVGVKILDLLVRDEEIMEDLPLLWKSLNDKAKMFISFLMIDRIGQLIESAKRAGFSIRAEHTPGHFELLGGTYNYTIFVDKLPEQQSGQKSIDNAAATPQALEITESEVGDFGGPLDHEQIENPAASAPQVKHNALEAGAATVEAFLKEVNELTTKVIKEHPLMDKEKIVFSESLFSAEDASQLKSVLRGKFGENSPIEIVSTDRLQDVVKRRQGKGVAGCVLGKSDYENPEIWNKSYDKATMLVLGEDLQGDRYLHIEGVVGLIRAMMAEDNNAITRYIGLLFNKVDNTDVAVLTELLIKDPKAFADKIKFKLINPLDIEGLNQEYRIKVETYLIDA